MGHADFTKLITEEGAKLEELYVQVRRTESRLDPYIKRACKYKMGRYVKKDLLEFAVCFLEVDPWFYRSGYLKQIFLSRLKRSDLDEAIKGRLRMVLLDAVDRRGTREFRYYCRLAAVIGDEDLVAVLEKASESSGGAVASRAKLMLSTIRQRQGRRVTST